LVCKVSPKIKNQHNTNVLRGFSNIRSTGPNVTSAQQTLFGYFKNDNSSK